jgi:Protein of unknown function (DUF3237)
VRGHSECEDTSRSPAALLRETDGFARLDVRAQLLTDDGAFICVNYAGLLELTEKVGQALATGGSTGFGDYYLRTTP